MTTFYERVNTVQYSNGIMRSKDDLVVKEKQLKVYVNGSEFSTLLCSPSDYEVLVAGYLLNRGLLRKPSEIREMCFDKENRTVDVRISPSTTLSEIQPIESACHFKALHLLNIMNTLEKKSETFQLTGGVHSAALADTKKILYIYEDIGRHNAVDKILGRTFLNNTNTDDKCLLLSGRVQADIVKKASRGGIPLIVSRSACSHLAIDLGNYYGITIAGFARGTRLNIYSHSERIDT